MNAYLEMNLVSLNPYMNTPLHRHVFLRVVAKLFIRYQLLTGLTILLGLTINTPLHATPNKGLIESSSSKNMIISGEQPNIIMFVMDDLNDWITPLGYDQAKTPNLDRLAKSGVTFENAHAPGVFCAPSRTAILTGMNASTTGCYSNEVFHYDHPDLVTLQMAFKRAGYNTYGAGKIYHHRSGYLDLRGWDEYFTRSQEVKDMAYEMNSYHMTDVPLPDPYPYSPYYRNTGREGRSALRLEWGPIPNDKEDDMADAIRTNWMCDVLKRDHDKPFFIALGMYSPHYPNYAPQKYFDMYNRDDLELPPYKEDDLEDLSPAIRQFYTNRAKQHQELEKYVSPMLVKIGGIDQIVMISASDQDDKSIQGEVVSFESTNGQPLWTYRYFNTFVNIAPPTVIGDGRLFLTNGSYGGQFNPISVMLRIRRKGDGFVVNELFRTGEVAGKMHPPVLHDGYLYFNGIRKPNTMRCLSLDGKVMWRESPNFQLGAFILADGLILNQDGKSGDLYLIEPSPDGYKELAKAELFPDKKGEPWAPLALSDGKLLIRDGRQMICVDLENPN